MSQSHIRISAPGKVILHGEHSVVYGKLALAASLGLRTRLEYVEEGDVVQLDFAGINLMHFYDLQDIRNLLDTPLPLSKTPYTIAHPDFLDQEKIVELVTRFVKDKAGSEPLNTKQLQALVAFFCLLYGILAVFDVDHLKPFRVKITTELAVSAGTGSSASFAVTVAAFLIQLVRVKKFETKKLYKNYKFNNTDLNKFDKNELDLISKWAFQAEKIIHGTPSGVDNTVCTYGAMVEFYKGASPKIVNLIKKFKVVLINTNIPRDTKAQVEKVARLRAKHKTMVDGILALMDETALSALDYIRKINKCMGDEFGALEYYETLGELTEINQNLLRCLNVSHPKLEEACQILHEKGLRGKLTGAGGGGFALCLIAPNVDRSVIEKLLEDLKSRGFGAVLTDLGGSGVTID